MNKRRLLSVLALLLITGGCGRQQGETDTRPEPPEKVDTLVQQEPPPPPEKVKPEVRYQAFDLRSDSIKKAFKDLFSETEKEIIFSLNRVDAEHAYRVDTLVVPDTFLTDWLFYSPFPLRVSLLDSVRKIVIFSYETQAFSAYEYGKLVRWGPSSMGTQRNPTPTGLHFCNWKSKKSISTVKSEWVLPWNFNIMNKHGVGWHQYDLPGYPASHSCLRLLEADAKWLYAFGEQWILKDAWTIAAQGTPVLVFGSFPYDGRKPWLHLAEDPEALQITAEELEGVLQPLMEKVLTEQRRRDKILAEKAATAVEEEIG